jgi:rod shape-determining protein MreD
VIIWRLVFISVVLALTQLGFLAAWRPLGLVPNLLLAAMVGLSLRGAVRPVLFTAVICGLALDLNSGAYFGLWTLTLPAAALAATLLQRTGVVGNDLASGALVVLAATLVAGAAAILGMTYVVRVWPVGLLSAKLLGEVLINELLFVSMWSLVKWPVVPKDTLPGVNRR